MTGSVASCSTHAGRPRRADGQNLQTSHTFAAAVPVHACRLMESRQAYPTIDTVLAAIDIACRARRVRTFGGEVQS
jgi:hypothetical protein